jgi:hypothetical protein
VKVLIHREVDEVITFPEKLSSEPDKDRSPGFFGFASG